MVRNVVAIILYNSKEQVLLQQRTDDAPTNPSKWGFFGGEIDSGEDKLEAIKRESLEELNYKLKDPQLVYSGLHPGGINICLY